VSGHPAAILTRHDAAVPATPVAPVSRRVDNGGVGLTVHDWGGSGAPILLAHATGFHGRVWAPVAARLVEAGRHVWSFDCRGHGDSDRDPGLEYHWERLGDDALAIVGDLRLAGGATLGVGHSSGAAALLMAEERRPGTFGRLWCYEPIVIPADPLDPRPDDPLAVGARKRRAVWASPAEARRSFGSRAPFDALHPDALAAYVDHGLRERRDGTFELKCRPEDEAAVYTMQFAHRTYADLASIECPVLVACGAETDAIVPKLGQKLVDRLPAGQLEVMDGLGHFGPLQAPAAAAASILRLANGSA
jgi:pimeloyl-ACP methyl ester carboxylesterase